MKMMNKTKHDLNNYKLIDKFYKNEIILYNFIFVKIYVNIELLQK